MSRYLVGFHRRMAPTSLLNGYGISKLRRRLLWCARAVGPIGEGRKKPSLSPLLPGLGRGEGDFLVPSVMGDSCLAGPSAAWRELIQTRVANYHPDYLVVLGRRLGPSCLSARSVGVSISSVRSNARLGRREGFWRRMAVLWHANSDPSRKEIEGP